MSNKRQRAIPPELDQLLIDFTSNVIIEQPADLISHASEYFAKLRNERNCDTIKAPVSFKTKPPSSSIVSNLGKRFGKRNSIFAEKYNPESDKDVELKVYEKTPAQRALIKEQIKNLLLFRNLEEDGMEAIIDCMKPKEVTAGAIIIKQGDEGDYFYLIDKGSYDVFIKNSSGREEFIKTYHDEGSFGELALLYDEPRAATIKAVTNGFLWSVDRKTFKKLVMGYAFKKRQDYIALLNTVSSLNSLDDYQKMVVCDALKPVTRKAEEVIFEEGDEPDGMFFIEEGTVTVRCKMPDGTVAHMQDLGKGEYFGELALVKKQSRAATVIAKTNVKLAFLDIQAFERLLGPCVEILQGQIDTYTK